MKTLFFYGTLRHLALLEVVLGRPIDDINASDAQLPGYAVMAVQDAPFPSLIVAEDATAMGLCVEGLSAQDIARLDFYEGSFDYDLLPVTLLDGRTVEVYLCHPDRWRLDGPWSLLTWQDRWGAMSVEAAIEVMSYHQRKTRAEVDAMFPMIRARATSRVNARDSNHGAGLLAGHVNADRHERGYANYFLMDDYHLSHTKFDGTMSDPAQRAVFVTCDVAIVLPYDPVRDRVLLVEQFRIGPWRRGDKAWQLEPVAGRLDPGETPETCARREAREEAGINIGRMIPVAECYPSPGCSTEFFYIYVGICDLPDDAIGLGGLETEQEDIRSHVMSFDDLMAMNATFSATNGPLILASYWLAAHRNRLRSGQGGDTR